MVSVLHRLNSETEQHGSIAGSRHVYHRFVCMEITQQSNSPMPNIYAKGGYTHRRPDAICHTFLNLMDNVCYDVEIEPHLQLLQSESLDN